MTSQPLSFPAPPRPAPWWLAVALAVVCAVGALLAATTDVYVVVPEEFVGAPTASGPHFCGSAYDVSLIERDGYMGGEIPPNQNEIDAACVSEADERMARSALLGLLAAVALAGGLWWRHRSASRRPPDGPRDGPGDSPRDSGPALASPAPLPVVDRVGALVGLFSFLGSITLAALFGSDAWWVNLKELSPAMGYVGILAGALLLTLLPRYPQAVFLACGGLAFALYGLGVTLGLPTVLMALVALFGVTLWTDRRTGLWALAASVGALAVAVVLLFLRYGFYLPPLETFLTDRVALFLFNSSGVVVLTWAVADQVRAARERAALQAQSEAHAAEAAAHQQAERAARGQVETLADRQRIAREMHDVVAHGLSVMIVQADGARFAAASDPDAATTALATIAATGRASLAEMRRLLSVLRDESEAAPETPQPGLADVPALVQRLVDGGRDVTLDVEGELTPGGANDATGLTAYRIAQEALTNVMKHAGDEARAWVRVTIEPGRVVVEVVDDGAVDGPSAAGPSGTGSSWAGHGLRGMRERVDMLGGHLVAGPDPRGGWRVVASLPRRDESEPSGTGSRP